MQYDHRDPRQPDRSGPSAWEGHQLHWDEPQPPPAESTPAIPLRFRILLLAPIALACAAAAVIGALFIYYTFVFPDPLAMRPKSAGPVIRIVAHDGSPVAERGVSRDYIPLDMLPPHAAEAVVAIEDRRFFEHPGLDLWGMARAAVTNVRAGRLVQGGSTITQQLAKNLFLTAERTWSQTRFPALSGSSGLGIRSKNVSPTTIPCVNNFLTGSLNFTNPRSRITFDQKRV